MSGSDSFQPGIIPTAAEQEARERTEQERRSKRESRLQFRFNALLTACAVISAAFVFYQVRMMNRMLDVSSRQAKASEEAVKVASDTLVAMKAQSEASERTARERAVAEDTRSKKALDEGAAQNRSTLQAATFQMRLDQRAWVEFVKDDVSLPGGVLTQTLWFGNAGKTPALNVSIKTAPKIVVRGTEFTPDYTSGRVTFLAGPSSSTMIPGGTKQLSAFTIKFDASGLNQIRSGEVTVYQFGEVTYKDVFRRSHRTTFCIFIVPSTGAAGDCREYNSSD